MIMCNHPIQPQIEGSMLDQTPTVGIDDMLLEIQLQRCDPVCSPGKGLL